MADTSTEELDVASLKVEELKRHLKKHGLATTGNKAALAARLSEFIKDGGDKAKAKEAEKDDQDDGEDDGDGEEEKVGTKRKATRIAKRKATTKKKKESSDEEEDEDEEEGKEDEDEAPAKKAGGGGGAKPPVDKLCRLAGVEVYEDYDCTLNQTSINNNNNKFYRLQLLEKGGNYWVWTRWGRVGENGQNKPMGPMGLDKALAGFLKKFKEKTGNEWKDRAKFKAKKGLYTLLEMEHGDDGAELANIVSELGSGSSSRRVLPCSLPKPTQDLLRLIFDKDMFKQTMQSFHIDVNRMPLGKLSKKQINKGYKVLEEIGDLINSGSRSGLKALSDKFYTLIPHSFGRSRPPVLSDAETLQQKKDMLAVLGDIELAQSLLEKKRNEGGSEEPESVPHELDTKYGMLHATVKPVDKNSDEYEVIRRYLEATRGSYDLDLIDVFRVDREGEGERFAAHEDIQNRKLLWHGTNVAVVVAILSSGLRIMPHSGGRVGKGIYFASENEKSSGYVGKAGNIGIMFLNEVALGKEHHITDDDSSLTRAPDGFDCVIAKGQREPDPSKDTVIKIQGRDIIVPQGKPLNMPQYRNSSFLHSEYLVYKESQCRIRYLLKLRFNN